MADIWYDVDTALAEVPVNVMPLLDATDFKTIEDAVAYNAAGMALFWHFTTTVGAYTVTAVTPTSGGNYDWTDQGSSGVYTIEIPASGGASINNDTEGFGWFTGSATGVLPWRGPVCGFRAAALNDSLVDAGTTGLLAPTTAGRTLDVTATGGAGIDWGNVENPTTTVNLSATNIDVDQVVASVTGAVGSVTGAVGSVTGNVGGNVTGSVGSVVGAVGSVTGNVGGNVVGTVAGVTPATAAQVAAVLTTQITEAYRANGAAPTLAQFMCEVLAHLGEASISGTTKTINGFDHSTPAETFTLDDATNPSSITRAS